MRAPGTNKTHRLGRRLGTLALDAADSGLTTGVHSSTDSRSCRSSTRGAASTGSRRGSDELLVAAVAAVAADGLRAQEGASMQRPLAQLVGEGSHGRGREGVRVAAAAQCAGRDARRWPTDARRAPSHVRAAGKQRVRGTHSASRAAAVPSTTISRGEDAPLVVVPLAPSVACLVMSRGAAGGTATRPAAAPVAGGRSAAAGAAWTCTRGRRTARRARWAAPSTTGRLPRATARPRVPHSLACRRGRCGAHGWVPAGANAEDEQPAQTLLCLSSRGTAPVAHSSPGSHAPAWRRARLQRRRRRCLRPARPWRRRRARQGAQRGARYSGGRRWGRSPRPGREAP